jgi:sterol desaturase/sphingolipid hydroxylase (fatty acid hydroxylase superfamily)
MFGLRGRWDLCWAHHFQSFKMIEGFVIIVSALFGFMALEYTFPRSVLEDSPGWWPRVICINLFQLGAVICGMYTWEIWMQQPSLLSLKDYMDPPMGGFVAYLINTWIFYFWHWGRHDIYWLWLLTHQVHHSARRLETITSFYKHPLEIVIDSIFMTLLLYPVLGLSKESSIWLSGFSAFGEYFYHTDLSTPHWVGYLFQRPESHALHHTRNKRLGCVNFSDIPLWDMLNGTFENPTEPTPPTGFSEDKEEHLMAMLRFEDVLARPGTNQRRFFDAFTVTNLLSCALVFLGLSSSIGYVLQVAPLRQLGVISSASPLP